MCVIKECKIKCFKKDNKNFILLIKNKVKNELNKFYIMKFIVKVFYRKLFLR